MRHRSKYRSHSTTCREVPKQRRTFASLMETPGAFASGRGTPQSASLHRKPGKTVEHHWWRALQDHHAAKPHSPPSTVNSPSSSVVASWNSWCADRSCCFPRHPAKHGGEELGISSAHFLFASNVRSGSAVLLRTARNERYRFLPGLLSSHFNGLGGGGRVRLHVVAEH